MSQLNRTAVKCVWDGASASRQMITRLSTHAPAMNAATVRAKRPPSRMRSEIQATAKLPKNANKMGDRHDG